MEEYRSIAENIMNTVSEALFVVNRNADIIYVNSAMVQLLGYSKEECLALNTYSMLRTGMTNVHIFERLLQTKRQVTTCQRLMKKNQTITPYLLVTQTPIFDQHGQVKYSVGIMRNVESLYHIFESIPKDDGGVMIANDTPSSEKRFIYSSKAMQTLVSAVDQIAKTDATILIQGESGTGKEVLAEYIHSSSKRNDRDMVTINCAALPENLLEAELFGYEKGAFTGAQESGKQGLIELAGKSTLFLDEVDSLPFSLQGKLLRVIETKQVRRLGSLKTQKVDFRLITATNAHLQECVAEKRFRNDLYYRLSVIPLYIPPLRERKEDIIPLCESFLERYYTKYKCRKRFSNGVYQKLMQYDWPGNVRELKNFVERIVLMTDTTIEQIDDVSFEFIQQGVTPENSRKIATSVIYRAEPELTPPFVYDRAKSLKENVSAYERWLVNQAVAEFGSLSKAATALETTKNTLIRKRK